MSSNDPSSSQLSDESWDRLAEIIDGFCRQWDADERSPGLDDFLPDDNPALRAVAIMELVKVDMEYRSRSEANWQPVEVYLEQFPELLRDGQAPAELVYEEFRIRKMQGAGVSTDQYQDRFPGVFKSLTRLVSEDGSATNLLRPSAPPKFEVGDRVNDFDLLTRLGKGAFATVFLARQNSMQRLVALKISADNGREHQMLAQLDHPHIVRVFDHRVINDPPVRLMYMQHIAGGTLQEVIRETREQAHGENPCGQHLVAAVDALLNLRGEAVPVRSENRRRMQSASWSQVVSRIGSEIAQAMAYAHDRNVLHRDLKPANVLLDKDCHVKLVDFNISFCSKLDGAAPTSYFGGSLAYMSPEQLEACSPDHDRSPAELRAPSDIFSLGIILYELAAGERPFNEPLQPGHWGGTMEAMIGQRQSGLSDMALSKLNDVSPFLFRAIRRCLTHPPEKRFTHARQLVHHLDLAGNEFAERAFTPPRNMLTRLAHWSVTYACGLLTIGISAAAALFIFSYNLEKSVPDAAIPMFKNWCVPGVNLLFFTVGGCIVVWITRNISRLLNLHKSQTALSPDQLQQAINENLRLGHRFALACITLWTLGGLMFPILLTTAGYTLSAQSSIDFVGSHILAGVIAGAYIFWMISWCALHVWQPRLLAASLDNDEYSTWTTQYDLLRRFCGFYHVLALAIPPIAITWLVLYHDSRDKFALTVVSIVSVLGLIVLSWASRGVQEQLANLKSLVHRTGNDGE